MSIKTSGRS